MEAKCNTTNISDGNSRNQNQQPAKKCYTETWNAKFEFELDCKQQQSISPATDPTKIHIHQVLDYCYTELQTLIQYKILTKRTLTTQPQDEMAQLTSVSTASSGRPRIRMILLGMLSFQRPRPLPPYDGLGRR